MVEPYTEILIDTYFTESIISCTKSSINNKSSIYDKSTTTCTESFIYNNHNITNTNPNITYPNITNTNITYTNSPIYIYAEYIKMSRNMTQTPLKIKGKLKCERSVSDFIEQFKEFYGGRSVKFVASGREDIDVRMLSGFGDAGVFERSGGCNKFLCTRDVCNKFLCTRVINKCINDDCGKFNNAGCKECSDVDCKEFTSTVCNKLKCNVDDKLKFDGNDKLKCNGNEIKDTSCSININNNNTYINNNHLVCTDTTYNKSISTHIKSISTNNNTILTNHKSGRPFLLQITNPTKNIFKKEIHKSGRPFLLQITNPTKNIFKKEININLYKEIDIVNCKYANKKIRDKILKGEKVQKKYYRLLVLSTSLIQFEDVYQLDQKTPLRVLHRRANIVRKRRVRIIYYKLIDKCNEDKYVDKCNEDKLIDKCNEDKYVDESTDNKYFKDNGVDMYCNERNINVKDLNDKCNSGNEDNKEYINNNNINNNNINNNNINNKNTNNNNYLYEIIIEADAGTYIKEFVSGDFKRTVPSLNSSLLELDVVYIEDYVCGDLVMEDIKLIKTYF